MNKKYVHTVVRIVYRLETSEIPANKGGVLNQLKQHYGTQYRAEKAYAEAYHHGYIYEPEVNKVRVVS